MLVLLFWTVVLLEGAVLLSFLVARAVALPVSELGLGVGPTLRRWVTASGFRLSLAWIPGGYLRVPGWTRTGDETQSYVDLHGRRDLAKRALVALCIPGALLFASFTATALQLHAASNYEASRSTNSAAEATNQLGWVETLPRAGGVLSELIGGQLAALAESAGDGFRYPAEFRHGPSGLTPAASVAVLALALALLNLLPAPGSSGGLMVLLLLELIRGRQLPPATEGKVLHATFLLIVVPLIAKVLVQAPR